MEHDPTLFLPAASAAAAGVFVAALVATASPIARIPVGMLLAMFAITFRVPLLLAAALGATGATAGRWLLASRGRAASATSGGAGELHAGIRGWLAQNHKYRATTFVAGATPFLPARIVFPLLGSMRAPIGPALAGSLVGQFLLLSVTTWVAATLARALTDGEQHAAWLLGGAAAAVLVVRVASGLDRDHWRSERRLRMRAPTDPVARSLRFHPFPEAPAGPAGAPGDLLAAHHYEGEDVLDLDEASVVDASHASGPEPASGREGASGPGDASVPEGASRPGDAPRPRDASGDSAPGR